MNSEGFWSSHTFRQQALWTPRNGAESEPVFLRPPKQNLYFSIKVAHCSYCNLSSKWRVYHVCHWNSLDNANRKSELVLLACTKTVGIKTFSYLLLGLIYLNFACLFSLTLKAGILEMSSDSMYFPSFVLSWALSVTILPHNGEVSSCYGVVCSFCTHGVKHSSLAVSPAQYLFLFGVTQCSLTWRNLDVLAFVTFLYYVSS